MRGILSFAGCRWRESRRGESVRFGQKAQPVQIQASAWERYQQHLKGMRPNNPSGEPREALEPAEPVRHLWQHPQS
ncbi:MAG: hypothetical protein KME26_33180 [Oscillatoria princeps RMCB-10]|jgi:hypothetical protein|nr:hypothetical protein [Oscillatoria princeps RMCB-10]